MEKPFWVVALEEKYQLPLHKIPGSVYILHWDAPTTVLSVSADYGIGNSDLPITHYVGWTQQVPPSRRINSHSRVRDNTRHDFVEVRLGTMEDEELLKKEGNCPLCGEALRLSLVGPAGYKIWET